MKKIVLYTSNKCPHCQTAKQFLDEEKIPYRLCNVQSPAGQKEFNRLGFRSVPVIKVGEQFLQGFSPKSFYKLLE
ncbi:MAG: glutaredoxin family protein [Thalassotalea sp.]